MIRFEQVTVSYVDASSMALDSVDLAIPEGELCLVVGPTGSGKSTLLRCVNGLVPHFTGGTLTGRVTVAGRNTAEHPPHDLADLVGYVGQVPIAGFVADLVEDEIAYGMESLGIPPDVMRRRVEETLDILGLSTLRDRPLLTLSAGEQQRVAIGAVLAVGPRVLVLDEPTSALDPPAAEDVLATLTRLVHDLGLTVVLAEHRLERVVQYADSVVVVEAGRVRTGAPVTAMLTAPVQPPVVELGAWAGWSPLPLSVRDARRAAAPLRARLADTSRTRARPPRAAAVVELDAVGVAYGEQWALSDLTLAVPGGRVTALMGRNGSGKSTLLRVAAGLRAPSTGTVRVADHQRTGRRAPVALVPHEAAELLWAHTVAEECRDADVEAGVPAGTTRTTLRRLAPEIADETHPRDLSEGQRLMLCLAVMLCGAPLLVALDEPTRGLDYAAKRRLVAVLRELALDGTGVLLATHDVELVAELADDVLVLADGELVASGPAADVVVGSPAFAPQVAKVMAPLALLTVDEVRQATEEASA